MPKVILYSCLILYTANIWEFCFGLKMTKCVFSFIMISCSIQAYTKRKATEARERRIRWAKAWGKTTEGFSSSSSTFGCISDIPWYWRKRTIKSWSCEENVGLHKTKQPSGPIWQTEGNMRWQVKRTLWCRFFQRVLCFKAIIDTLCKDITLLLLLYSCQSPKEMGILLWGLRFHLLFFLFLLYVSFPQYIRWPNRKTLRKEN